MTIGTSTASILIEGDGTNTAFQFPFLVPQPSNLAVTLIDDTTGVETPLLPTQYTAPTSGFNNPAGGTVFLPAPPAAGTSVFLQRVLPLIQSVSIANQGPTFAAIESGLDYLTMLIQAEVGTDNAAIRGNPADPAGLNYVVPTVAQRALKTLFFDSAGNVVVGSTGSTYVSTAMAPVVAAITVQAGANLLLANGVAALNVTGSPSISLLPTGQGYTSRSSYTSLNVYAAGGTHPTGDEFGLISSIISTDGYVASPSTNMNRVAIYGAVDAYAGSGNVWAGNFVTVLRAGFNTPTVASYILELDFANQSGTDYGDSIIANGLLPGDAIGVSVSGGGTNTGAAAFSVQGNTTSVYLGLWNVGYYIGIWNVNQVGLLDEGYGSASTTRYGIMQKQYFGTGVSLQGTYANAGIDVAGVFTGPAISLSGHFSGYGIDTSGAAYMASNNAIRIGAQHKITARNALNTGDVTLLQTNGTTDSTSVLYSALYIGDSPALSASLSGTTYIIASAKYGFMPAWDNAIICGSSSNRWSAIWAANGTIQTSDPSLKHEIQPLSGVDTTAIINAIQPIAYKWLDGGGGRPGQRQHWGWDAAEVGRAFEGVGEDFGGFVRDDKGGLHLRPDQLLPVLWQEVRNLRQQLAATAPVVAPAAAPP